MMQKETEKEHPVMSELVKRGVALVLALVICVGLMPHLTIVGEAANYIYNWGKRGELATAPSEYADSFYTGNYTYDILSGLSGGTSEANVPNSALYKALHTLMESKHSYQTSYDATRDKFQYTDCQNGSGKISSFYSGKLVGPTWDGGSTWNREHTWPNSKGDASGNGENDLMMLRPASVSENSSRGNKAYGTSGSFYDPNNESGGTYNLHGDVARIVLYVYVRWECTNTGSKYNPNGIFGTDGIIESLDVLLAWMEEDPVDTWELGRNDAVQSITGTRNVFVDYPELAFLLFGEEIPAGLTTPSGEGANKCDHNNFKKEVTAPTCTEKGYTVYTCGCGNTYTENYVDALGHSFTKYVSDKNATTEADGTKTAQCDHGCGQTHTVVDEGSKITQSDITSDIYDINDGYISKIGHSTTVESMMAGLNNNANVEVYRDGKPVSADAVLGTGMVIRRVVGGEVVAEAVVVVTGDTSGDGKITITDMLAIKAHLLKKGALDGASGQAADVSGDSGISITDFIQLKAHILGKSEIKP